MTGRSPARLLAPLALVTSVLALYIVVTSGGSDAGSDDTGVRTRQSRPSARSTTAAPRPTPRRTHRTYTVRRGDTPSSIAERVGISLDTLLELNPDVDPQLLSPGQRLKLSP